MVAYWATAGMLFLTRWLPYLDGHKEESDYVEKIYREVLEAPKKHRLFWLLLDAHNNSVVTLIAKDTTHFSCKTWTNQSRNDKEILFAS